MKSFKHGDKAFINSKRVAFGTTQRYYEEMKAEDDLRVANGGLPCRGLTVAEKVGRSIDRGNDQHWILSDDNVVTGNRSIRAAQDVDDELRPRLSKGDTVELDHRVFRIDSRRDGSYKLVDLTLGYVLNAGDLTYKTVDEALRVAATLRQWVLRRFTSVDDGQGEVIDQCTLETIEGVGEHVPTLADKVAFNDERDETATLYRLQQFNPKDGVWNFEPNAPGELASLIPLLLSAVSVDPTVGWRLWPA